MKIKVVLVVILGIWGLPACFGQVSMNINAVLNDSTKTINIQQVLTYQNTASTAVTEIHLNDWANSFKDKSTPLARRFAEDYIRKFHFAKEGERGATTVYSIANENFLNLEWERPEGAPDIIRVSLEKPLLPGEKVRLNLLYRIKIPSHSFTRFGYDNLGNFKLKYWYITPGVYDGQWHTYSDKNIGDQYSVPADLSIKITTSPAFFVGSPLNLDREDTEQGLKTTYLSGKDRISTPLYLTRSFQFESLEVNNTQVVTNVDDEGLELGMKERILQRILEFLELRLGTYPHKTLMVTKEDHLNNPVYGLNQLPQFIRPFPDGFQYDIKQLKLLTEHYLKNSLILNPREEQWVYDAIHISLMKQYVDTYYPDMKILGSLSEFIGIRWFHVADLEFNDQYPLLYLHMARLNLDQALTTPQDSLLQFNKNIANAYKAGAGLGYLEEFLQSQAVSTSIQQYFRTNILQPTSAQEFREVLESNAEKDISWFFDHYVSTNEKIDFRISNVVRRKDSLEVTLHNKMDHSMPVSLYGLKDGEVVYKTWVENPGKKTTLSIPREGIQRLALNYEGMIPELNQRDNYHGITTLLDKPVQFRLLKDIEDPRYYQFFFMPEFSYNLYDGIAIGPKLYNKTLLNRNFEFSVAPKYGFTSKTLVGSASLSNTHYYNNEENLFSLRYGISGVRYSYGYNLFYEKFSPFLRFNFRNPYLRDNERQSLVIRNINVQRDLDPESPVDQPNYNVFNVRYNYSDANLVDFIAGSIDYELAKNFSKVSAHLEYRKLFRNNRQINLRFFAGTFLYNDETDNDYFSFALDRPTDYLFDYNYYGRSQSSGLFSQQIIVAEGGFKSQLEPGFANQWLSTINASTTLWNRFFAYGDIGLVKNHGNSAKFVYDSGIRLSLVEDYFEVYFPVYSNLGWEIAQENYDRKIRFIVTLDLNTLIKLFNRRWY